MEPCEICGRPGQRHHIVFRSQGGMNIRINFAYLCAAHHTDGPEAVHNNRALDLKLKIRLQRELEVIFREESYCMGEIAAAVSYDRRRLAKRMSKVPAKAGRIRREDIIRFFMGGRLYDELRLPAAPGKETEGFSFIE